MTAVHSAGPSGDLPLQAAERQRGFSLQPA